MNKFAKSLSITLVLGAIALPSLSEDLVIYHTWSAESEVAGLNVLKAEIEKKGHKWKDVAVAHDTGSNVNLMSLVTGGKPPNIFSEPSPSVYRQLKKMGLSRPLNEFYKDQGALEHFPRSVVDSITVDGDMVKVPLGIQIDGMMYYSKEVAEKSGVDPEAWESLDAMYSDFKKVQEAGFIPLAVGAQQWQIGYLSHALAAAIGGQDFYNAIYGPEPKSEAIESDDMKTLLTWLRKFQEIADAGSINRDWNMTTNMVITGQALMQIHGDWMKGEWRSAGKEVGVDFGCAQIPGAKAVVVTVDGFGLLGGQSQSIDAAELDFAAIAINPDINTQFAKFKGSTPVRLDIKTEDLDKCSQAVLSYLAQEDHQVINPHSMVDADWQGSLWDVYFNFWSDQSMTVEDAVKEIKNNYETIM